MIRAGVSKEDWIEFINNYLGDFLYIATSIKKCNKMVKCFLEMCEKIGMPISKEKMEWGRAKIIFLGVLLDGDKFLVTIPEDKRVKVINMLQLFMEKKKSTVKLMEQLAGYLNFLNKAIVPGRAFTRYMYVKFTVSKLKLKLHHHIAVD